MDNRYLERVSYKINQDNLIISLSDDWVLAATTGNAPELTETDQIIDTNLLSYIHDEPTRIYYEAIFQKCRVLQVAHSLKYRCDSPTHQRHMEMEITPVSNGDLIIENYLYLEKPFKNPLYIGTVNALPEAILRCSICNNLKLSDDAEWIHPEHLSQVELKKLTVFHSICPFCTEAMKGK